MRKIKLWRRKAGGEAGVTLIEILGAVMILSIISVTLMGYFTAGLDKSADQSRRIIAANLARLKAAEIREQLQDGAVYAEFVAALPADRRTVLRSGDTAPGLIVPDTVQVNGTGYRFELAFDKTFAGTRKEQLAAVMGVSETPALVDGWLVRLGITVRWDPPAEAAGDAPVNRSVAIDSYIVGKGD